MKHLGLLFLLCLSIYSCGLPDSSTEVELDEQEFAIPLINSRLDVSTVTDNTEGTSIEVDSDGRLTVFYRGDVVEQGATDIFAAVDTVLPIPIVNGIAYPLPVTEDGDEVVSATFGNTNIWFSYNNDNDFDLKVNIVFNEFSKDGAPYSVSFIAPANTDMLSDTFSLEGVDVNTSNNSLTFNVSAEDPSGTTVTGSLPIMYFDQFILTYVEGKFAPRVFDIDGDIITVGIFDNWISGNVTFVDPKLRVSVDNGFGLPVEAIYNNLSITTTEDEVLEITSTLIDNGVTFAYPDLDERGQVKNTTFSFNRDNSNIVDVFGQRAAKVTYDIDALVNPNSPDLVGFVDQESFFRIKVDVEIPLEGTIDNFVLEADTELDASQLDDIEEAVFKVIFDNSFPIDMYTQAYFVTDSGVVLDSLFDSSDFLLEAGVVGQDGRVSSDTRTIVEIPYDAQRIDKIQRATKLNIRSRFNTPSTIDGPAAIYNDYGMGVKMGARVIIK